MSKTRYDEIGKIRNRLDQLAIERKHDAERLRQLQKSNARALRRADEVKRVLDRA